ncbi:MAG: sigma-70 family RNA polymerase sigma factor [Actinomycetaceae bacterium]|nr:sigma-70 family RNA polymerase sigma factor [Actinomycetaceae bacterium]
MANVQSNKEQVTISYTSVKKNFETVKVTVDADSELGRELIEMDKYWVKTDRANSRHDRHSLLSEFTWAGERFTASADIEQEFIDKEAVATALAGLSDRQRFLIEGVVLDGYSFAELARVEGKDESAIRHAYNRAIKRARKILESNRPDSTSPMAYSATQQQTEK